MENKLSIKVISQACGILPHTLRIWEQRYQVFNPERTEQGQRRYSESDLEKAKLLAQLLEYGYSISALALYSLNELQNMAKVLQNEHREKKNKEKSNQAIIAKKLIKYLADYQLELIVNELQYWRLNLGVQEFIFEIVLPTLQEIGWLVAKGKYSITQEHLISTLLREQLTHMYFPLIAGQKRNIALATPEGNLHELSILIASTLCNAHRLPSCYLGPSHPAECLAEAITALNCSFLVLGVISSDHWDYKKNMIPYLQVIDRILQKEITVILGGGLPLEFPRFKNIKDVKIIADFQEFSDYLVSLT